MRNKRVKPETYRQAKRQEQVAVIYAKAGLCWSCAAQAGWGHQQGAGWQIVYAPCRDCSAVVAQFPIATSNPLWRKMDLKSAGRWREADVIPWPRFPAVAYAPQDDREEVAS